MILKFEGAGGLRQIQPSLMVELLVAFEPHGVGGQKQVRPVAPPLQEASEILPAQFVALVVVQLRPLPVLVADQG